MKKLKDARNILKVLRRAKEKIRTEDCWCSGSSWARDRERYGCDPDDPLASEYSAKGAVALAAKRQAQEIVSSVTDAVVRALEEKFYNDTVQVLDSVVSSDEYRHRLVNTIDDLNENGSHKQVVEAFNQSDQRYIG